MNPELLRNLRLEFSLQRVIALPVILAVIFALVWFVEGDQSAATRLYIAALVVLYAIVFLWGVRKAAGSLAGELANDTWDAQRLSAMSAGELLLGKLLGGASYPLYGALLCLVVAFVASFLDGFNQGSILWSTQELRLELLIHAMRTAFTIVLGFVIAAVLMNRRLGRTGVSVTLCQVLAVSMVISLPGFNIFPDSETLTAQWDAENSPDLLALFIGGDTQWYGLTIPSFWFRALTLSLLLFWSILGARNLLRDELKFRGVRCTLAAFMVFWIVYFGGLAFHDFPWLSGMAESPSPLRKLYPVTLLAWFITIFVSYLVIFLAPKSMGEVRRFISSLGAGDLRGAALDVPAWLVALEISLLVLLAQSLLVAVFPQSLVVSPSLSELGEGFGLLSNTPAEMFKVMGLAVFGNGADWGVPLGLLGFYGMLVRDLSLVLLLNLSASSGRGDLTALLYLTVLYLALPALLYVLDLGRHAAYLLPSVRFGDGDAVAVHWLQAIAMLSLLAWRWQQTSK